MQDHAATREGPDVHANVLAAGDRTLAVLAHMSSLLGYAVPFGQFIGPHTVELLGGAESGFVRSHTREALNFQVTILLFILTCLALAPLGIGWFLFGVVLLHSLVQTVRGAGAASRSEPFRYPFSLRLLR